MVRPKGDKQVEYLDLDLDSGKSTPPRKVSEALLCRQLKNTALEKVGVLII